jgi:hypothetical protein
VKKVKIIIVGSGFSAFIAKILLTYNSEIYSFKSSRNITQSGIFRNFNFEINKFFSNKTYSYGPFRSQLKKISLHSYNQPGGNTNIWGGFINLSNLNKKILMELLQEKLKFVRLSLKDTGSISNCKNIFQMQDNKKNIFKVTSYLNTDKNYYLESFRSDGNKIKLIFYDPENNMQKIKFTKKLILGVGVVEFIYLLFRSGYLKNQDVITLSEFKYNLEFKFGLIHKIKTHNSNKSLEIRFDLFRAFFHFLGIQKNINFVKISKIIPIYVQQKFSHPLNSFSFKFIENTIIDFPQPLNDDTSKYHGKSIHYCNLKINSKDINRLLSDIHPGIIGIGMPFVLQKNPGPICNDIINDAIRKIARY